MQCKCKARPAEPCLCLLRLGRRRIATGLALPLPRGACCGGSCPPCVHLPAAWMLPPLLPPLPAVNGSVRCLAIFVDEQGDEQVGWLPALPLTTLAPSTRALHAADRGR